MEYLNLEYSLETVIEGDDLRENKFSVQSYLLNIAP